MDTSKGVNEYGFALLGDVLKGISKVLVSDSLPGVLGTHDVIDAPLLIWGEIMSI